MLYHVRKGHGRRLLLVHGLGGSGGSWAPIVDRLAAERELIIPDLPGHGRSEPENDSGTFAGQVRALEAFIAEEGLGGVDMAGSSMGARLVLELARRGGTGAVVALDPGGFWNRWEAEYLRISLGTSVALLRAAKPLLGPLGHHAVSRTALLTQLSARPWALNGDIVTAELDSFATSRSFDPLLHDLANGPVQQGPAADRLRTVIIGWGRQDRLCLPRQALRAAAAFPTARLHWFDNCGHFPMWDRPEETAQLILTAS